MAVLSNVIAGQSLIIEQHSKIESIYTLLMSYGIYRGTKIEVLRNDHWQEMMLLKVKGKRIAVRRQDVAKVEIKILERTSIQSN